jgi:hypothetical protein
MVQVKKGLFHLLIIFVAFSIIFQVWQVWKFVNAGARFTALDGQELCERIRTLEQQSYGYRDAVKKPLNCEYGKR